MNDATVPLAVPAVTGRRHVLVTGGAGFIGCNLADRLAQEGHNVLVVDTLTRDGVAANLAWLTGKHPRRVSVHIADVRDTDAVTEAVRQATAVFHLAAQVAVTTSMTDPAEDLDINLCGTFRMLNALRAHPGVPFIFASTNKVYGDLADIALELRDGAYLPVDAEVRHNGIGESRPLSFHTPYGCSKGAADQYTLDFARSFGVPTAVLRMSCIYGQHQMGNEDQGWVAHFLLRALRGEPVNIFGDGCQVRDILHVDDAVAAYVRAWRDIGYVRGSAFNLGGGPANAVSLRQVIAEIEAVLHGKVDVQYFGWRPGDQRYYVSNTQAIAQALDWRPKVAWRAGIARLAESLRPESFQAMALPG